MLWRHTSRPIQGNPVNQFVKNILLEERIGEGRVGYLSGEYRVQYQMGNEEEVFFVALTRKAVPLCAYDLLSSLRKLFLRGYPVFLLYLSTSTECFSFAG